MAYPIELFQAAETNSVMILKRTCQQIKKQKQKHNGLQTGNVQYISQSQERRCKECNNSGTLTLISPTSTEMLKVCSKGFYSLRNKKCQMVMQQSEKEEALVTELQAFTGYQSAPKNFRRWLVCVSQTTLNRSVASILKSGGML